MAVPEIKTLEARMIEQGAVAAVLALDMALTTGCALRHVDGTVICWTEGFHDFRKATHPGELGFRFRNFLERLRQRHTERGGGLHRVYYEKKNFASTSVQNARIAFGLEGNLLSWCRLHEIEVTGVAVATVKKHVTGHGHAPKTIEGKRERNEKLKREGKPLYQGPTVEEAIAELGHHPMNPDEADALAVLHYGIDELGLDWTPKRQVGAVREVKF